MNLLKIILCLFLIVYSCASANAQSRTLTGKVISSKDGNGVPGATISIKQNSKSFSASNDGSFSISVPPGIITLTVSYVGYAIKEITVGANDNNISIQLDEDLKQLNEVVVVGYSEKKRSELTSAVSVVSSEKLKDCPQKEF